MKETKKEKLFSNIETMLNKWRDNGTKNATTLTRQIVELFESQEKESEPLNLTLRYFSDDDNDWQVIDEFTGGIHFIGNKQECLDYLDWYNGENK